MKRADSADLIFAVTCTFQDTDDTSEEIDFLGTGLFGIDVPASFSGTALSFEASVDGGANWREVFDDSGNAISLTVAADTYVVVSVGTLPGFPLVRIVSNSAASGIESLTLLMRAL